VLAVCPAAGGTAALSAKAQEARRLVGGQSGGGHGVVLVLAARARLSLEPVAYEESMRAEFGAVAGALPLTWPLLWCPGPAELGLLPARDAGRAAWVMPQVPGATGAAALSAWLRYLLAVRPAKPAM